MLASQLGALGGLAGAAGLNVRNPADTYIALIKSRTVADALIERFDLLKVYDEEYRQEARKELEKRTAVSTGKDGLIKIEVDDKDPKRAAELALGQTGAGESLIRSAPQAMVEGIARLKAQVTAQEIRLSTRHERGR